jgi:hypothetical protein
MKGGRCGWIGRLLLEPSDRRGHDWSCVARGLEGGPDAVIKVIEWAETGWIYDKLVAAGWLVVLAGVIIMITLGQ